MHTEENANAKPSHRPEGFARSMVQVAEKFRDGDVPLDQAIIVITGTHCAAAASASLAGIMPISALPAMLQSSACETLIVAAVYRKDEAEIERLSAVLNERAYGSPDWSRDRTRAAKDTFQKKAELAKAAKEANDAPKH